MTSGLHRILRQATLPVPLGADEPGGSLSIAACRFGTLGHSENRKGRSGFELPLLGSTAQQAKRSKRLRREGQ